MPSDKNDTRPKTAGRKTILKTHQKVVMNELHDERGIVPEALAVGFGVSFNTVRGILAESESAGGAPPTTDTPH